MNSSTPAEAAARILSVRLEPVEFAALSKSAAEHGTSVSDLIRVKLGFPRKRSRKLRKLAS